MALPLVLSPACRSLLKLARSPALSPVARLSFLPRVTGYTRSPANQLAPLSTMAPIPPTMKAVQISQNGGVEVLEYNDVPVPTVGEGQILVRNHYAGLNFIDTYFRSGLYKVPHFPLTLGREGAGEVIDAHSSVSNIPVGSRVVFMGTYGTYGEYSAVAASDAIIIPDALSTDKAAAAFLQGLTAWTFIREAGEVKAGQWVLVHAAAGGVGGLLVQMLRAIGAKTIGTASTEEKCELARKYGAGWTINSNDDIVAKVKEITGGHGADVIFDGVGKSTFDADIDLIAPKGHLVSFGNAVSRSGTQFAMMPDSLTPYSLAPCPPSTSFASPPSASS